MRSFVHHTLPVEPTLSSSVQEMIVKYQNKKLLLIVTPQSSSFSVEFDWAGDIKEREGLEHTKSG